MPVMNGCEATIAMNEYWKTNFRSKKHPPIIGLTAYTDKETIKSCSDSGMAQFHNKPVKRKAIVKCLVDVGIATEAEAEMNK